MSGQGGQGFNLIKAIALSFLVGLTEQGFADAMILSCEKRKMITFVDAIKG